ncbi:MAG: helix-turn-helix domain-containing protein [Halobacteriales archaeon]
MTEPSQRSPGGDPRVVGVDEADADEVVSALGSETARAVLAAVHEEPTTASELAERRDVSIQAISHHLDNLVDAGLVEPVDTRRAETGNEMTVYGPAEGPVLVFAGDEAEDDLRSALSGLLSGLGILAVASLLVQEVLGDGVAALLGGGRQGDAVTAAAESAGAGPPPGVVFFLGGAVVLVVAAAFWYWRRVRAGTER